MILIQSCMVLHERTLFFISFHDYHTYPGPDCLQLYATCGLFLIQSLKAKPFKVLMYKKNLNVFCPIVNKYHNSLKMFTNPVKQRHKYLLLFISFLLKQPGTSYRAKTKECFHLLAVPSVLCCKQGPCFKKLALVLVCGNGPDARFFTG